MADTKEYRTALGFIYAGPFEREVTTQGGVKTLTEYMLSAVGLNGDVELKLSFWDSVPDFVKVQSAILVSGKYDTYNGKDREGNEKIQKTLSVNKAVPLGDNQLVRTAQSSKPAPKKRPVTDEDSDLGF